MAQGLLDALEAADPFQLAEDVAGASMICDLEGTAAIEDAADDASVDVAWFCQLVTEFCARCPFGSLRSTPECVVI